MRADDVVDVDGAEVADAEDLAGQAALPTGQDEATRAARPC